MLHIVQKNADNWKQMLKQTTARYFLCAFKDI